MLENIKETFLETLHDLSLSIAYLRNSTLLPYETKLIASRCKISESEVYHVLETAKKKNGLWKSRRTDEKNRQNTWTKRRSRGNTGWNNIFPRNFRRGNSKKGAEVNEILQR